MHRGGCYSLGGKMKKLGKQQIQEEIYIDEKLSSVRTIWRNVYERDGEEVIYWRNCYRIILREDGKAILRVIAYEIPREIKEKD